MHSDWCVPALALLAWNLAAGTAAPQQPEGQATAEAAALACAPGAVFDDVPPVGPRVLGAEEGPRQALFGTGDTLVISAGANAGLKVDEQFFVRRRGRRLEQSPRVNGVFPVHVNTAGWVRLIDVAADHALAAVVHACDGIIQGDYLEPFAMPTVPAAAPLVGEADYFTRGRVLFGLEGKLAAGSREYMVVDMGAGRGLAPGQRLTVFREHYGPAGPVTRIGHATALAVYATTAIVRVDTSTDAVYAGDFVAVHRPPSVEQ